MAMSFFNPIYLENAVRAALDEDLGRAGDITTLAWRMAQRFLATARLLRACLATPARSSPPSAPR